MTNENAPPDPPMKPAAMSTSWFESGPEAISSNLSDAVLLARIGMAANALGAQMSLAAMLGNAPANGSAHRLRDSISLFVTSAAITFESMQLAQENMATLREAAALAGASDDLLKHMGRLCAGKHPAYAFLSRSRNQLGYHWDKDVVQPSVESFTRNQKIVWYEYDDDGPVQTFAHAVLQHAMFPEADTPRRSGSDSRVNRRDEQD